MVISLFFTMSVRMRGYFSFLHHECKGYLACYWDAEYPEQQ